MKYGSSHEYHFSISVTQNIKKNLQKVLSYERERSELDLLKIGISKISIVQNKTNWYDFNPP